MIFPVIWMGPVVKGSVVLKGILTVTMLVWDAEACQLMPEAADPMVVTVKSQ